MTVRYWTGASSGAYSTSGNWSPGAVPQANDDVVIQGAVSITSGLDQSAVAIDTFTVLESYTGAIGTVNEYLEIDVDDSFLYYSTGGPSYIDIAGNAISPQIFNTKAFAGGDYGLYLKGGTGGTAVTSLTVHKGAVHVNEHGGGTNTSSFTTINVGFVNNQSSDSKVLIAPGTTVTNLNISGGEVELQVAAGTINMLAGVLTTTGSGAITTLNLRGGAAYPKSNGVITSLNASDGTIDFTRDSAAKVVTNFNADGATITFDKNILTITNLNADGIRTIS